MRDLLSMHEQTHAIVAAIFVTMNSQGHFRREYTFADACTDADQLLLQCRIHASEKEAATRRDLMGVFSE